MTRARRKKLYTATFTLSVVLLLVLQVSAQTVSGTLRGTVTDPNGAIVPNATVTVKNTETGLERTAVTSDEGLFNFTFLPIGNYTVDATRTDFNRVTRENVNVRLNTPPS